MKRTILTTVGTSLLTNPGRTGTGWKFRQPLPPLEEVDAWLAVADPIQASAETHTWFRLGLFEPNAVRTTKVVLIHSHTAEGEYCARRLSTLAQTHRLESHTVRVDALDYNEGGTFERGLRQLARVIGDEIRKGKTDGGYVELAATGGFKAEIAIANLVGAISSTPVHYIYQEFSRLITIEPIPVMLNTEWVGQGACKTLLDLFSDANDIVPYAQVESLLKRDPQLMLLLEVDGKEVALNLLGELARRLVDEPHESWPTPSEASPASKIRLDSASHHRPKGWESVVALLADCPYVTSIRYEGQAAGGKLEPATNNDSDLLHFLNGAPPMTLRISTTAQTPQQRLMVRRLLAEELRLA